jgi:hypothetical protein
MVEFLFRKGINSISVNADAAHDISLLINQLQEDWKNKKEQGSSLEKTSEKNYNEDNDKYE